jgi:hypothetical protein
MILNYDYKTEICLPAKVIIAWQHLEFLHSWEELRSPVAMLV